MDQAGKRVSEEKRDRVEAMGIMPQETGREKRVIRPDMVNDTAGELSMGFQIVVALLGLVTYGLIVWWAEWAVSAAIGATACIGLAVHLYATWGEA